MTTEHVKIWRLKKELLRLTGAECGCCGQKMFPSRDVCKNCGGRFIGVGTIVNIETFDEKANHHRELAVSVNLDGDGLAFNIQYNGKHLKLEAGMKVKILERPPLNGESGYFLSPIASGARREPESSRSSK